MLAFGFVIAYVGTRSVLHVKRIVNWLFCLACTGCWQPPAKRRRRRHTFDNNYLLLRVLRPVRCLRRDVVRRAGL